jgi:tetratricopeptide (TPR) repeat protein
MLENYLVTNAPGELAQWLDAFLVAEGKLDPYLRARAYRMRGATEVARGGSREWYEQSLDLFRSLADDAGVGHILLRLGMEADSEGDVEKAEAFADESDRLGWKGRPRDRAIAAALRAHVALRRGDEESALALLQQSADIAGEGGFTWWRATQLADLADHLSQRGQLEEAKAVLDESLRLFRSVGDRDNSLWALGLGARIGALQERGARAGVIWGAIEAEAIRAPSPWWDRVRAEFTEALAAVAGDSFDSGRRRGRSLSFDEAIDYALSDLD